MQEGDERRKRLKALRDAAADTTGGDGSAGEAAGLLAGRRGGERAGGAPIGLSPPRYFSPAPTTAATPLLPAPFADGPTPGDVLGRAHVDAAAVGAAARARAQPAQSAPRAPPPPAAAWGPGPGWGRGHPPDPPYQQQPPAWGGRGRGRGPPGGRGRGRGRGFNDDALPVSAFILPCMTADPWAELLAAREGGSGSRADADGARDRPWALICFCL